MTISAELLAAYRFHRSRTRNPRKWQLPAPNAAWDALNLARADVAANVRRYPPSFDHPPVSYQDEKRELAFLEIERLGIRVVGYADEIKTRNYSYSYGINHTGWHTRDDGLHSKDGWGICRGVVLQLPARNGVPRYLAGYRMGDDNGGFNVDLSEFFEDERGGAAEGPAYSRIAREAAARADRMAEIAAEKERDYNRAWEAGNRYTELGETAVNTRREILGLCSALKFTRANVPKTPETEKLCGVIREKVKALYSEFSEMRAEREKLKSDTWASLHDAFNEGAGARVFG